MSTPEDRSEQADLFGLCLTGVAEPEPEEPARPAPRREEDHPQRLRPTR